MPASTCLRRVDPGHGRRGQADRRAARRAGQALLQAGAGGVEAPRVHLEGVAAERRGDVGVEQGAVLVADRDRARPAAGTWSSTCRPARSPPAPARTRAMAAASWSVGTTSPHGTSTVCTSAPQRSAISTSRWPKRPMTGTSTRSPGSSSDTSTASIPARAVPSTRNVASFAVRNTSRYRRHHLVHRPGHRRVELADQAARPSRAAPADRR